MPVLRSQDRRERVRLPAVPGCVAMSWEDRRTGRLFSLIIGGSVLGSIVAFTGTMIYVGIADTYRLVVGAWGSRSLSCSPWAGSLDGSGRMLAPSLLDLRSPTNRRHCRITAPAALRQVRQATLCAAGADVGSSTRPAPPSVCSHPSHEPASSE